MDKLKAKLIEAMNQRNFKFDDLMKIIFEEVKEMQETIENQQDDLMRSLSVELEQKDKIKELKNTIFELEQGNQNNIKSIENWMDSCWI
jgi:hypothetical protein